jgi:maltose-binding protein MalE
MQESKPKPNINNMKALNNPMRNTTSHFMPDRKNNSVSPLPFE